VLIKLNEHETGRVVRVNVNKVLFYKTIRVRKTAADRYSDETSEVTGIRFENEPVMLVVTESVEEVDELLKHAYIYIK